MIALSALPNIQMRMPIYRTQKPLHFGSFCNSSNKDSISPTLQTLASYLETCPDTNSLTKLHARIITSGLQHHILLASKLLRTYATFNNLHHSTKVFNTITTTNLSLWNSTLVTYFRTHHFNQVLTLYTELKQQNIGLDSSTFTFCFKSSAQLGELGFGRQLHGDTFKFGVNADRFVGSALIGLYGKSREDGVEVARKVFDEITEKDVVAYTAMVTGYAQVVGGEAYEGFRIVGDMLENGFEPNRVTLVSLLQVAGQLGAVLDGRAIHGYAVRREIGCLDEVFNTCLVDMYVKCGTPYVAEVVFSRMVVRSVACWNALITGHVQIGQPLKGLEFFGQMMEEKVVPDLITLSNVLLCCAELEFLLQGRSIHAYILRSGKEVDVVAATALIDMYCKCNNIMPARELFQGLKARDTVLFNVMIAGYVGCKSPKKALETFHGMVGAGMKLNPATILNILSASAQLTDIRVGKSIHCYVVRKALESNTDIANQILYMYAKCSRVDIARRVFSKITNRDLVSWTSMMMGYVHHGCAQEALELFRLMLEAGMEPDSVALLSLLQAFSHLGCLKVAKEIHSYIYRMQLEKEIPVINSLSTTYAKCGRLDMAKVLFEHTGRRGLTAWNTMISACGMHGNCKDALDLYNRMKEEKVKPDELTFTSLISACSHVGLVEEGQAVFTAMTVEHSILPREEHYGSMVDLYARAGRLEEALDLIRCLPRKNSTSALAALLAACRVYRNIEIGEIVGKQLLDLEPYNSGAYTLLSSIFAEAGKWDEAARLRTDAMSRSVSKQTGYSKV